MSETDMFAKAVRYAESRVTEVRDWQDVQHELAIHNVFGPWIDKETIDDMDAISLCQRIIHAAEENVLERGGNVGYSR